MNLDRLITLLSMRGIEIDSSDIYGVVEEDDRIIISHQGQIEIDKRAIRE